VALTRGNPGGINLGRYEPRELVSGARDARNHTLPVGAACYERPGFVGYLKTPALWGIVGIAGALGGQTFYVAISGNSNLEAFASSFTSALLWYRWLPSATNPIGIIPGVLIVSLPAWGTALVESTGKVGKPAPLRFLGLGAMLLALMAGGLVVSTKIGGGGDLHNMDAYLVMLAVVSAYGLGETVRTEATAAAAGTMAPWPILLLMVLVPTCFALMRLRGPTPYDGAWRRLILPFCDEKSRTMQRPEKCYSCMSGNC